MKPGIVRVLVGFGLALAASAAPAAERSIGEPVEINGMEIAAVYLQAVKMDPAEPATGPGDIHLEADVHASKANENGFGAGDWIPYLDITYRIDKVGSDWSVLGSFMPMVASDGPHYGANLTLDGPGEYEVRYHFVPPLRRGLYRHVDRETGVAPWWAPFDVTWRFKFLGTGKKGGY